jgi:hypothetical protein
MRIVINARMGQRSAVFPHPEEATAAGVSKDDHHAWTGTAPIHQSVFLAA